MTIKEKLEILTDADKFKVSHGYRQNLYTICHRDAEVMATVDLNNEDEPKIEYYLTDYWNGAQNLREVDIGSIDDLREFINNLENNVCKGE